MILGRIGMPADSMAITKGDEAAFPEPVESLGSLEATTRPMMKVPRT